MPPRAATTPKISVPELIFPRDFGKIEEKFSARTHMIIYGEEDFAVDDLTDQIVARLRRFAERHHESVVVKRFHVTGKDFDFAEFFCSENTMGLFGASSYEIEVVRVLDNLDASSKEVAQFYGYLNSVSAAGSETEKSTVVVFTPKKNMKDASDVAKATKNLLHLKNFLCVNCKKLYDDGVLNYARILAARSGKTFTDEAIACLAERCRMNMFQIASQIKRLTVLNFEQAELDRETVERDVETFFDPDSYAATGELDAAIYRRDLKKIVEVLAEMLEKMYYAPIVMRIMSIFRAMLSTCLLKEASETFASGGMKIAREFAEGVARRSGFEKFRFSNECIAKFEFFCDGLVNSGGVFRTRSRHDLLNATRNQSTLSAVHYSKNYTEEELFSMMRSLYEIDVRVRTGRLRPDINPGAIKEELYRIFILNLNG